MEKDILLGNLKYTRVACEYARKINKAAQIANKAMFRARDVRKARQELAEQQQEGFEFLD